MEATGFIGMDLRDSYLSLVDALSAIRQLSDIDLENLSEAQFLQQALKALVKHQDLDQCSIFLVEDGQLHCAAGTGLGEQLASLPWQADTDPKEGMSFSLGEGLMGMAYKSGQIQYCRNCHQDERFLPFRNIDFFSKGGSLICVPLKTGDTVLGVLNVSHPMPEFFETWHQHFLMLFANCVGRFLHVHRLLHQMEDVIAQRTIEIEQALSESENIRQRYQKLSTIDELTGLHNRRYFFAEGESMLARAIRYELPISLLLMDVDYFKRINDTWGHALGDQVLKMIANVLNEEIRTGDMVARLGGEEFVLLLSNTGAVGADLLAKRIQERISKLDFAGEADELMLTVSIGMASLNGERGRSLSDTIYLLYKQADSAMYMCKRQGRNRRLFYTPEMENIGREDS